jgi:hypothetical protein
LLNKLKAILYTYLCLLLLLSACDNDTPPVDHAARAATPENTDSIFLIINQESLPLKEAPSEEARNIATLKKGTKVFPTGEVSSNKTLIYLDGIPYNEPWIFVSTTSGKEGWVYGAILQEKQLERFPNQLMHSFLGEDLMSRLIEYQVAFHSEAYKDDMLSLLEEARALQRLLNKILQQADHLAISDQSDVLQSYLPALVLYKSPTPNRYSLFLDFKEWAVKAQQSHTSCDDQLIELYFKLYPIDSIEYFYPSWSLEVNAGQAYSLLGEGVHISILRELDELLDCHDVLQIEIDRIKEGILNDILQPNVLYWEEQQIALNELAEIVGVRPSCLQDSEYQYIVERLETLQADSLYTKTLFNFRSGIR